MTQQTKAPFGARIKAAFQMVFGGAGGSYSSRYGRAWDAHPGSYYPGSTVDYSQVVGSPWHNSAVSICLGWIADNLPQARIRVTRDPGKGEPEEVKPHLLTDLLRRPNHAYSGRHLLAATAVSRCVSGDAYWMKARSSAGFGKPVELWHVPFWMITPQWDQDGSDFITSYLYRPDGAREYPLKTTDVVHFRAGLDPENNRLGWSPLKAILREIATDNEIASYTRALLTNLGVPGAVMSPRDPAQVIPEDARREIEDTYAAKFTKDNRGRAMVVSRALNVEKPAFSPEEMALDRIAKRPEARICAALKLPAMVVGLNVAEETRTYSNWGESREAAWDECIIPMLEDICETLDADLLPDLGNSDAEDVAPDFSKVRALQEDQDAISARATKEYQGGGLMLNEYRQKIGQPEVDGGKVFFIPKGGELVKEEELSTHAEATTAPKPPPVPFLPESGGDQGALGGGQPALPAGNGNGANPAKAYAGGAPVGFRREAATALKGWVTLAGGQHIFIDEEGGAHPGGGGGSHPATTEATPTPSQKAELARRSMNYANQEVQRYSEEHNEPVLAAGLKGKGQNALSLRDNEPVDVIVTKGGRITDGVELKTVTIGKNAKITQQGPALSKKAGWQKENGADLHTVVFDDSKVFNAKGPGQHDESQRAIYYRRGAGSFRLSAMHPVKDMAELRSLIASPRADLPAKAQPPGAYEGVKSVVLSPA